MHKCMELTYRLPTVADHVTRQRTCKPRKSTLLVHSQSLKEMHLVGNTAIRHCIWIDALSDYEVQSINAR